MRRAFTIIAVLFVGLGLGWLLIGDHGPPPNEPAPARSNFEPASALSPLHGSNTLTVTVVDPKGAAVHDAEVVVEPWPHRNQKSPLSGDSKESRRTDESGVAAFELAAGDYVVEAVAAGFLYSASPESSQSIHLSENGSLDIELTLARGATVSGRVVSNGEGTAARVAYREARTGTMGQEIPTKDDGTFSIVGVPPGQVRIHVKAPGAGLTVSPAFDVDDGEHLEGIEIEVAPAGSVVGKLRTESGDPVVGWVSLEDLTGVEPRRVTAGVDGSFRIGDLREGEWVLVAEADGYEQTAVEVAVLAGEEASVEIVLSEAFGVRGVVVGPDGTAPESAVVQLLQSGDVEASVNARHGRFRIELEPPSGATVVALSPQHADSEPQPASTTAEVELSLKEGGFIEGVVRSPDGTPVQDFEIGVESYAQIDEVPFGPRSFGTVSFVSSDGSFEFGSLRPGRYWLRAAAPGFASASAGPIDVRPGSTSGPLEITLSAGGVVRGRVTTSEGKPLKGAQIQVFDPFSAFATARTRTADDGFYELGGVPPGRRSIRVAARGYLTNVASGLDVLAGGEVIRDVVMERAEQGQNFVFGGIGAVLRSEEDAIVVQEALQDRPASIFGLQAGDRIMAIDGRSTAELRLGTAVELIRGEEGVAVELEIEREGEGRLTVEVERGRVVIESGGSK